MKNKNSTGLNKQPPHATDVEELVLGAMMLEKDCWQIVSGILTTEMFYLDKHQYIHTAISELEKEGSPIDIATVTHKLIKLGTLKEVGGPFAVTQMTNRVASAANIEYHSHLIKQAWIKREMIRLCAEAMQEAFEPTTDCFDSMRKSQSVIDHIMLQMDGKRMRSLADLAFETKQEIISRSGNHEQIGLSTGFVDLDYASLGLMKSDLIVVAARPGMGKTAFAMQIAKKVGEDKTKKVAVFSLEMRDRQLVLRIIAGATEINSMSMMRGTLEYEEQKVVEQLNLDYPNIIIDDTPALTILKLRNRVMKIKALLGGLDLIVVDYIQLMAGEDKFNASNREGEVSEISRGLKQIAKDFDVPVIALSQLSRKVEDRGNKRPQLSDLRESGAIEQDADAVWFLFRPDYYSQTHEVDDKELCLVIIAKSRHGSLQDIKLRFIGKYVKFKDYEESKPITNNQISIEEF